MRNVLLIMGLFLSALPAMADGRIEVIEISSENFESNKVGIDPVRRAQVYLPDGYDDSDQRYGVLFGFATFFENETALFENYRIHELLDAAIADGRLPPVIVVTPDFSTPAAHSLFVNSGTTGNWESFMIEELVPFVDQNYRTLQDRNSRGLFGNHIGGYGAIRYAARYPDLFGAVYALHPVATTSTPDSMVSFLDWELYEKAVETGDLSGHWSHGIFTSFFQAYLPNPDRPPIYADIPVSLVEGEKIVDEALIQKLTKALPLIEEVETYADNLKQLNGFKFDWGRFDPNEAHTTGNLAYSQRLRDFGVPHVAESYNGGWDEGVFERGGRIDTDLFPFFAAALSLEPQPNN